MGKKIISSIIKLANCEINYYHGSYTGDLCVILNPSELLQQCREYVETKLHNIPSSGVITVTSVYGPVATVYALMTHSYV